MKITKRRTGYTIRVNDSEFEMLNALVTHAIPQAKGLLESNAKGAYTRRAKATNGDILHVDADTSTAARGAIHENFLNQRSASAT